MQTDLYCYFFFVDYQFLSHLIENVVTKISAIILQVEKTLLSYSCKLLLLSSRKCMKIFVDLFAFYLWCASDYCVNICSCAKCNRRKRVNMLMLTAVIIFWKKVLVEDNLYVIRRSIEFNCFLFVKISNFCIREWNHRWHVMF